MHYIVRVIQTVTNYILEAKYYVPQIIFEEVIVYHNNIMLVVSLERTKYSVHKINVCVFCIR